MASIESLITADASAERWNLASIRHSPCCTISSHSRTSWISAACAQMRACSSEQPRARADHTLLRGASRHCWGRGCCA
eukprot:2069741-Pleurochrysis_carterae.AAC.2